MKFGEQGQRNGKMCIRDSNDGFRAFLRLVRGDRRAKSGPADRVAAKIKEAERRRLPVDGHIARAGKEYERVLALAVAVLGAEAEHVLAGGRRHAAAYLQDRAGVGGLKGDG